MVAATAFRHPDEPELPPLEPVESRICYRNRLDTETEEVGGTGLAMARE